MGYVKDAEMYSWLVEHGVSPDLYLNYTID